VERFLRMSDDFTNINIDDECCCDEYGSAYAHNDDDPFQN
jgi:hypothetical protein